jgi:hypothetical protein
VRLDHLVSFHAARRPARLRRSRGRGGQAPKRRGLARTASYSARLRTGFRSEPREVARADHGASEGQEGRMHDEVASQRILRRRKLSSREQARQGAAITGLARHRLRATARPLQAIPGVDVARAQPRDARPVENREHCCTAAVARIRDGPAGGVARASAAARPPRRRQSPCGRTPGHHDRRPRRPAGRSPTTAPSSPYAAARARQTPGTAVTRVRGLSCTAT